jgi:predicted nucleic acid-binding Zn ribbon protein
VSGDERGRRGRSGGGSDRRGRGVPLSEALRSFLAESGLTERVEQAAIVPEWAQLVGPTIARVTEPLAISRDGTLFVAVTTNAWMAELSLMEPELLSELNRKSGRPPVARIRWRLRRD